MKIEAIVTKTPGKLELLELEKQTLLLAAVDDGKKNTSSSPSARGTTWQLSRQSSGECPSDMRQKR
jgi:hypothetical protein